MHWSKGPNAVAIRKKMSESNLGKNKGKVRTEEFKRNASAKLTGIKRSPETCEKMRVASVARNASAAIMTLESRAKSAISNKGRKPWHAGQPMPAHFRQAISAGKKGKTKTWEHRRKMSEARKGPKSPQFWRGGMADVNQKERARAMRRFEYRQWRGKVFERDNFTCQMKDDTCSGPLNADHIKSWRDYPELRYDVGNGRALCSSHHQRTPNYAGRVFKAAA